jgi:hypothetical protein
MKQEKEQSKSESSADLSEEEQKFVTFLAEIIVDDAIKTVLNRKANKTLPGEVLPGEGETV